MSSDPTGIRAAALEEAARALEAEGREWETQFGPHGVGGHTAAVLIGTAAQIVRGLATEEVQPQASAE